MRFRSWLKRVLIALVVGPGKEAMLCPWHGEKTPSLVLDWEAGTYHCFGCGRTGDISEVHLMQRG